MNFTPFGIGTTFAGGIPAGGAVAQFTTAKFANNVPGGAGQVVGLLSSDEAGVTYLRPVDANGFTLNLAQGSGGAGDGTPQIITLPISITGSKPSDGQQTVQIQVVNPAGAGGSGSGSEKYAVPISLQPFTHGNATVLTLAYSPHQDASGAAEPIHLQLATAPQQTGESTSQLGQNAANNNSTSSTSSTSTNTVTTVSQSGLHSNEIVLPDVNVKDMNTEDGHDDSNPQAYPVAVVTHIPSDLILKTEEHDKEIKDKEKKDSSTTTSDQNQQTGEYGSISSVSTGTSTTSGTMTWGTTSGGGVAGTGGSTGASVVDYINRLTTQSLPLSLHHYLKFSPETIKREQQIESSPLAGADQPDHASAGQQTDHIDAHLTQADVGDLPMDPTKPAKKKKKYKKKAPKPRKPRPGQVHIAFALDGTTLFCCPECNMAYPEKELLEQHLVAHKIERRFICDICGAGLKRKEHLERHKLGHNPERPYICSVCCKGFKRKEHLNLHFVIHSGEKSEVCPECGKGFHRKDHLRKHARSHVAKRVKEEMGVVTGDDGQPMDVCTPVTVTAATPTMILTTQHHHQAQQQQQQQPQQQH